MSKDKEFEIQLQFLDEAQEYLTTLESAILGISSTGINGQKVNAALRAAHSIKGGAGMMQFHHLSGLAHRLEDALKVLKTQKNSLSLEADLEALLLTGVDQLRQVITANRRGGLEGVPNLGEVDPEWLQTQVEPIFEQIYERLGEPQAEDASSMLAPEEGQNVVPLFFETEVEGCLQRLEQVLETGNPRLLEEVAILAQELGGLGEMLQLGAFTSLCQTVTQALEVAPEQVDEISRAALQSWRRSQALVLTGNLDALPTSLTGLSFTLPPLTWLSQDMGETFGDGDESWNEEWHPTFETLEAGQPSLEETVPEHWMQTWHEVEFDPDVTIELPLTPSEVTNEQPAASSPVASSDSSSHTVSASDDYSYSHLDSHSQSRSSSRRSLEVKADNNAAAAVPDLAENTVRVQMKQLNLLNDLLGELTIERSGLDLRMKRLRDLMAILSQRVQVLEQSNVELRSACDRINTQAAIPQNFPLLAAADARSAAALPAAGSSVPTFESSVHAYGGRFDTLELDRYSSLSPLSQEVMETIVQIQEVATDIELELDETEQTTRELNKTARQLQRRFTQVRMRPLSDIVDRFPRALRELSLQYGKSVNLKIYGGNTLIDRNILEALSDPLMHLLRNAFDHGIEDPETRRAQGKPEQGTIEIRAAHRSNRTVITLRDDGAGIALDKIRARARKMGLDEMLLAAASDEELLSLIFEPGFTTSDRVTDLSGRGVGMDVVRNQIRQVRGEIQIDTETGVGTTFTLSVPYNLSITRVLLTESNGLQLAFPSDAVEEMLSLTPEQILHTAGSETFEWQGEMVPLVRLRDWLTFNCPRYVDEFEIPPSINTPTVLMVSYANQRFGLEIQRSWGGQEVAVRQVEGHLGLPPGFSGCTILGDGRVVPLVSIADLLHWILSCERSGPLGSAAWGTANAESWVALPETSAFPQFSAPPALPAAAPIPPSRTILVVDDSVNVRRFLALTLEKAGYRVEQAKDGQDALDKLTAGLDVQAVICDIEMPRLDGYGLLAQLKSNAALSQLPVTMLTSRSSDKHRQLAMNLGATAYFSKPYNEQALLQTLAQMV